MSKPFKKDAITDSELMEMLTQIDLYFNHFCFINVFLLIIKQSRIHLF